MAFWSLNFIFKSESHWEVFLWMRFFFQKKSNHNVYFRTIHVSELKFLNQNWSKTLRHTKIEISPLVFGVWSSYLNLKRLGRFSLECAIFFGLRQISDRENADPTNWWSTGEILVSTGEQPPGPVGAPQKNVELRKSEHMAQRFIMSLDSPESMAPYLHRMLSTKVLRRDSFTKWSGPLMSEL